MTALQTEARRTVPVFEAMLAICRTASERDVVLPFAEQLAYHAGARLELACAANETYTTLLDAELSERTACRLIPRLAHEHRADVVAMTPCVARGSGRRLLDAGTAVLVVPPLPPSRPRVLRIGIGYDGGRPADAALKIARALVAARPSPVTHMDVMYVDDSASGSCEAHEQVVSSRREAILEWWLEDVARQIPTPVRVSRPAGDAANELAQPVRRARSARGRHARTDAAVPRSYRERVHKARGDDSLSPADRPFRNDARPDTGNG